MYLYVYKDYVLTETILIDDKHIFDIGETIVSSKEKYGDNCMILASQKSEADPLLYLREELVEL